MQVEKFLQENFIKLSLIHETETTKIWLVKKISTDEKFVLKIISRRNLPYSRMLNIEQKNLPKIFLATETESETFVLEEYLQGLNLLEYIKLHGEFSEQTIIKFADELCECLKVLHARKILHRDIKPSNLFLTDAGELKLIDFDAGRFSKNNQENDTQIIGTPGFAPPEQYGFQQTDDRADIFALGMTLKLLLGFENYHGILSPILDKCTEFDPARRYKNVEELQSALRFRKNYFRLKKFLISTAAAGMISISLLFNMKFAETPQFKIPAEEKISVVEEKNIPTEIIEELQPEIIYYENYSEPVQEISEPVEEKTDRVAELITNYNDKPENYNVEVNKMSRKEFDSKMQNLNLSAEESAAAYDEYYRRVEISNRTREFMESLPEDLSAEEKNRAHYEFYKSEKKRMNIK